MGPVQRNTRRKGATALLAACVLLALPSGCASEGQFIDIGPFYEARDLPSHYEVVLPLFFTRYKTYKHRDASELNFLWPLGEVSHDGKEETQAFLPFYWHYDRIDRQGFHDTDTFLMGNVTGTSTEEGDYWGIIPFFGNVKGIFGKDRIDWVMFPGYARLQHDSNVSHHVLFPFVNWMSGGGQEGWRVLPFFAHYQKYTDDGRQIYDRKWLLWPFITWQTNNMDRSRGEPTDLFFFLPFFGYVDGATHNRWTALWPFFQYTEKFHSPTDPDPHYWELRAPFPFVVLERGEDRQRTDVWPLFGIRTRHIVEKRDADGRTVRYNDWWRMFILEPIMRFERHETESWVDEKDWVMPIYWRYYRRWGPDDEQITFKIWPLFRYRKTRDGAEEVNILSPLWFKDPEIFEKIWNPLFRVYHHYHEDGVEHTKLLWGLYSRWETEEEDNIWVHPFLWHEVEKKQEDSYSWYFLFGLFQYHERGRERALRFFWLPEISWESDEDDVAPHPEGPPPDAADQAATRLNGRPYETADAVGPADRRMLQRLAAGATRQQTDSAFLWPGAGGSGPVLAAAVQGGAASADALVGRATVSRLTPP